MPISPPARRLDLALVLVLALAITLLAMLLAPAGTLAKTRKGACQARSAAHAARAKPRRSGCATRGGKATRGKQGRRHAGRHAAKTHRKTAPTEALLTPALCEDQSSPVRASDGSFSCDDGSEPGCEGESSPVRSGSMLECAVSAGSPEPACGEETAESFCYTGAVESEEPVCEDGSAPATSSGGPPACDDGSEPHCEDASAPTRSAGHGLVCDDSAADAKSS